MLNYDAINIRSKTLNFPERLCAVLDRAEIRTIGDLRKWKKVDLQRLSGMGTAYLNIVHNTLVEMFEQDDPLLIELNMRLTRIEKMLEMLV